MANKRQPKKQDDTNQPWVSNYPPLHDWLQKHEASCNQQLPLGPAGNPTAYLESWIVRGGGEVLALVRANRLGWNLYTAPRTNSVPATLADAEARLGLVAVDPHATKGSS